MPRELFGFVLKNAYSCQVCSWPRFFIYCYKCISFKTKEKNKQVIHKKKTFKHYLQDAKSQSGDEVSFLKKKFAMSKVAKAIWNVPTQCFISNELRTELRLLHYLVDNPMVK